MQPKQISRSWQITPLHSKSHCSTDLTHIFQQSLSYGRLPTDRKHTHITPVYKKGNRTDPKNYHPISLTSVVCLYGTFCYCYCYLALQFIVSQLMKHLKSTNILTESQFGFKEHHLCESQLFGYSHSNKQ